MQLLYEIISLQKFAMSKKRTFTYNVYNKMYIVSTLFFYFFLSLLAFLVPATVSCARIPGVFIDNRMCLINIKLLFLLIVADHLIHHKLLMKLIYLIQKKKKNTFINKNKIIH
jgi:hypothetical protein